MKALLLYRPDTDHERLALEYQRDFNKRTAHELTMLNLDTVEGADAAKLYDVVDYPAIIVTSDDGVLARAWEGKLLPLISELEGYLLA